MGRKLRNPMKGDFANLARVNLMAPNLCWDLNYSALIPS